MSNNGLDKLSREVFGHYYPYIKEAQEASAAFIALVVLLWGCRTVAGFFFPPQPEDLFSTVLHVLDSVAATCTALGWITWVMLGIGVVWLCINVKAVRDKYHRCKRVKE